MSKRIKSETINRMLELREAGHTYKEIAQELGFKSYQTISKHIKKAESEGVTYEDEAELEDEDQGTIKEAVTKAIKSKGIKPEAAINKIINEQVLSKSKEYVAELLITGSYCIEDLKHYSILYGQSLPSFLLKCVKFYDNNHNEFEALKTKINVYERIIKTLLVLSSDKFKKLKVTRMLENVLSIQARHGVLNPGVLKLYTNIMEGM